MTVVIDSWDYENFESSLDSFLTNSLDIYKKNLNGLRKRYELFRVRIYLDIEYYREDVVTILDDESSLFLFMLSDELNKVNILINECLNHNLNLSPEKREMEVLWDNPPTDPDSVICLF